MRVSRVEWELEGLVGAELCQILLGMLNTQHNNRG